MSRPVGLSRNWCDKSYRAFKAKILEKLEIAQISAEGSKWRRYARTLNATAGWARYHPQPISQQECPQTYEVMESRYRANTESRNRASTKLNKTAETREQTLIATKLEFDVVTHIEKPSWFLFEQAASRFPRLARQWAPTLQAFTK